MLEGRAVVGETDMSQNMQDHAMLCASEALDMHEVTEYEAIARFIKKKFDKTYGVAWQCIVGFSFGSSITHVCGTFIYFHVEKLAFLLFKDALLDEDDDEDDVDHVASGSGSYVLFNQGEGEGEGEDEDEGHMGVACGKADFLYLKQ